MCNTSIFIMNTRILLYLHMGAYQFAWVVIIKSHRLGGLNNNLFSHSSGDESPRSSCQDWFLIKALFLVDRWPPNCCVLVWPFLCVYTEEEVRDLWCPSLLIETPAPWECSSTLRVSFNLSCFIRGLITKYSHLGSQGVNR